MQSQAFSSAVLRVPTRMLVVGGLHLLLIWALVNGLNVRPVPGARPSNLEGVVIIDKVVPPESKLAPPVVSQSPIHPIVKEPPPVEVKTELDPPLDLTSQVAPAGPATGSGTAQAEALIAAAGVDPHRPLTQPPYPPASIRSNEEGALALDVLVGVDGRVRDAKVSRSSGSPRLDQAAVNEARVHWRLRPATRNGTPFEQWLTLRVVFRLENR